MVKGLKEPHGFVVVAGHRAAGFGLPDDGVIEGFALANLVGEARRWNVTRDDVQDVTLTSCV